MCCMTGELADSGRQKVLLSMLQAPLARYDFAAWASANLVSLRPQLLRCLYTVLCSFALQMQAHIRLRGHMSSDLADKAKQTAVVDAFMHSWRAYTLYAWGADELCPVTKTGKTTPIIGNMGATLIDSMSTLWMMGLTDEFDRYRVKLHMVLVCKVCRIQT